MRKTGERGLVICCPIQVEATGFTIKKSVLDPQELRFSLLLWDKLDFPTSNAIHIEAGDDVKFLANQGILRRTPMSFPGGRFDYRAAHVGAYELLNKREPGVWSLATGENSISFLEEELDSGRGALVTLHRAIPVPDKDVPLAEVLEFRSRRRDELLALRHHLESIYQRILTAGDRELALNSEVEALEAAIVNHIKVSKESGLRFRNASFNAGLNISGAVAAGFTAFAQGLGVVGSLITGGTALLAVNAGVALKRGEASETPFRYVSSYHEQLF